MLLGGDEIGRSQKGNNNAYCQDNDITWHEWNSMDNNLLEFVRRLIEFRAKHPVFRRRRWFQGEAIHGSDINDIGWFTPDGKEMAEEHWGEGFAKSITVFLNGEAIPTPGVHGERIVDDSFCILFNAHYEPISFTLPNSKWGRKWMKIFATNEPGFAEGKESIEVGSSLDVESRSLVLLCRSDNISGNAK